MENNMVQIELTDKELRILINVTYNAYYQELRRKSKNKITGETLREQMLLKTYNGLKHELLERNKNKKSILTNKILCVNI